MQKETNRLKQHPLMIKTLSKPGTERTLLNLIRGISLKRARVPAHTHTHTLGRTGDPFEALLQVRHCRVGAGQADGTRTWNGTDRQSKDGRCHLLTG